MRRLTILGIALVVIGAIFIWGVSDNSAQYDYNAIGVIIGIAGLIVLGIDGGL